MTVTVYMNTMYVMSEYGGDDGNVLRSWEMEEGFD